MLVANMQYSLGDVIRAEFKFYFIVSVTAFLCCRFQNFQSWVQDEAILRFLYHPCFLDAKRIWSDLLPFGLRKKDHYLEIMQ